MCFILFFLLKVFWSCYLNVPCTLVHAVIAWMHPVVLPRKCITFTCYTWPFAKRLAAFWANKSLFWGDLMEYLDFWYKLLSWDVRKTSHHVRVWLRSLSSKNWNRCGLPYTRWSDMFQICVIHCYYIPNQIYQLVAIPASLMVDCLWVYVHQIWINLIWYFTQFTFTFKIWSFQTRLQPEINGGLPKQPFGM